MRYQNLNYKEAYPSNKDLAKLMIGFANSNGGYVILGVRCESDSNLPEVIIGIDPGENSTKITQIQHIDNEDKDIIVIKINEAVEPIMFMQGNKFLIRINDKIEYAD
ncbi:MAG: helix-turn-helix domain-containing protein [Candidatus Thorarchaeota archaeon]